MGAALKFKYGTEAQILALTPDDKNWVEQAFYYPDDKSYFFQIRNGIMKKYGAGTTSAVGIGIFLNGLVIGGVKREIENNELLEIPEKWEYNVHALSISGIIDNAGQINIL